VIDEMAFEPALYGKYWLLHLVIKASTFTYPVTFVGIEE
jgi:hypothetical protein